MKTIQRLFLTGLLVLLPVSLSLWILFRLVIFLENILAPVFKNFLTDAYRPGLGVVSLLLVILLVGFLASNFLGRKIVDWANRVLERLPLFNRVYLMIKGISDSILGDNKGFFEGVALVPFPGGGTRTLGFITSVSMEAGDRYIGVFVPTTPNITTGFYLMFPREEVEILDITVEEGLKRVLSFGITTRRKNGLPEKAGGPDDVPGKKS